MGRRLFVVLVTMLFAVLPWLAACPAGGASDDDTRGRGSEGEGEGEGEGEASEGEGEGSEGEGEGEGENVPLTCADVVGLTLAPGRRVDEALRLTWEIVVNATVASGNEVLRTTGTLDGRGTGLTYSAQPSTELVFLGAGVEIRVVVEQFSGDLGVESATDFFVRSHDVAFTSFRVTGDVIDGESHLGGTGTGTRLGAGTLADGATFSFTSQQTASFDFGSGTLETFQDEVRQGTVRATGIDLAFTEGSAYHAVFVDNFAEDLQTGLIITGTADGASWSLDEGLIRRTFQNGRAIEPSFWAGTTGAVSRGGGAAGALAAVASASTIEVRCGDDVLERHSR